MHRHHLLLLACALWSPAGCSNPLTRSFERSQIYQPLAYPQGDWNPSDADFENAFFEAEDGTRIHGWYFPHPEPRGVVLFAHGNAGNLTGRLPLMELLRERHAVSILIFDYRGYGRSEGTPEEEGILQDARAARQWLAQREQIPERDIVLMGRSLGGGVATDLAAQDDARALVLINTFTSLPDVAKHHMPLLAASVKMSNQLNSREKIARFQGRLLQVHGDRDALIPYEQAAELFYAANSPKQFVTIDGGEHNGPLPEEFHEAFDDLLDWLQRDIASRHSAASRPVTTDLGDADANTWWCPN